MSEWFGARDGSSVLCVIKGNSNADDSREGYEIINHPRSVAKVRCVVHLPA